MPDREASHDQRPLAPLSQKGTGRTGSPRRTTSPRCSPLEESDRHRHAGDECRFPPETTFAQREEPDSAQRARARPAGPSLQGPSALGWIGDLR